ncbi:hypothetical protein LR48_Vigan03g226200 [Vigna angularis]|uniref:Pentatricopeptide repeat-containing protein n=2 Tax=Phaseolus angularis TaxID=3914 RepID=A0A0L9U7T0_PHAAN|nr:pentatricopeptide repeat-containing protein At2g30780 [Vigna angularis]XP_017418867.1 pentatricopeptide repeat-containing protein At2g30780 [Vigna angularis]XP_052728187.1 pentatricopeptide repeat-containing protein At2g30780 [Vigna angularis]XP_052728188.1 pentatricopeptide repeat-containing protein At2g30780 [Vigna angularis]BAT85383.1 hypothetical protein VIGAN_04292300 [Vigna angularis var. angularis]KAG2405750.1 Pentatricopeptide repeat-containing protein [Vigna angularis]KOM38880.1 h
MKRVWRFSSHATGVQLLLFQSHFSGFSKPKHIPSFSTVLSYRQLNTVSDSFSHLIPLFTVNACSSTSTKEDLINNVTILRNELIRDSSDHVQVQSILDYKYDDLSSRYPKGYVFLELMYQLKSNSSLALKVFNWRRKRCSAENPMDTNEYSKGIIAAGRSGNIHFAIKLFKEAATKGVKTTSTYNALMSAFSVNGLADCCQSLFCDLKRDSTCDPSIVTYNILISSFGSLMLVDHMEATFREIRKLDLAMNISTYNNLIVGYITAWMWDDMEKVFQMLKSSPVQPNMKTYLLMLRGYANSGNLEKMEDTYSIVRDHVNEHEISLIRSMICAHYRSSEADKLKKIELLLKFIPEEEYKPWLNVLMIKLYAKEDLLEKMENAINKAFEHGPSIRSMGILRCIAATYYRCNAVEKLENFVRRAEISGWSTCRSLYHCKLVMYGSQKPLHELYRVLEGMENAKLACTKKTLWIMHKAYSNRGQSPMVLKTLGLMFKHGYEFPLDAIPS